MPHTISALQGVGERVEVQSASNGEGCDKLGRCDESVGGRVSVITAGEVTVVRGHNGVLLSLLDILTVPLTNARATSIGQDSTTELAEGLRLENKIVRNAVKDK